MAKISVYTRDINPKNYPFGLATSVHFIVEKDGVETPLNQNYGILFVQGEISKGNTIIPLGASNPRIYLHSDGTIRICARRITEDGASYESDEGKLWSWTTTDFKHFETVGLVDEDALSKNDMSDHVVVDDDVAVSAINYWNPPTPDGFPSDEKFTFPLAKGFGDPVIFPWEGKWYFISTSDNTGDVGIYVREADTVHGLFEDNITQHLILPYDTDKELIQTFWAPEFHVIGGQLYILFAVSGQQWGPQCHLMKLKKGGSIIDPDSWSDPVMILKKDGSPLSKGAISLDMTYLKSGNRSYVVWSYREGIGHPHDTGSMLCIASIDEKNPHILTSDPVLLSRPLYGWENVEGTINNEAPYAFIRDGKINLTYSGGAANGYTYAVGLFTAYEGTDLLDLNSWTKSPTPILNFYLVPEYGPGHNSFFTDENGNLMIAYHGETDMESHLRCDMIRKVFFKEDGTPFFR